MHAKVNPRDFIKAAAAGVGGASALSVCGQNGAAAIRPLRVAVIGCGGRGTTLLPEICNAAAALAMLPKLAPVADALRADIWLDSNASVIQTIIPPVTLSAATQKWLEYNMVWVAILVLIFLAGCACGSALISKCNSIKQEAATRRCRTSC